MRGVGDITQETVGPADIIGQVSSPSGGEIRRERERERERGTFNGESGEHIINILWDRLIRDTDYIVLKRSHTGGGLCHGENHRVTRGSTG